jgi:hypothetical protein
MMRGAMNDKRENHFGPASGTYALTGNRSLHRSGAFFSALRLEGRGAAKGGGE